MHVRPISHDAKKRHPPYTRIIEYPIEVILAGVRRLPTVTERHLTSYRYVKSHLLNPALQTATFPTATMTQLMDTVDVGVRVRL